MSTGSPILLHYANGSCTADWLRQARAIEAACDLAPLSTGPLAPEAAPLPGPYAALAAAYERNLTKLRADPDLSSLWDERRLREWAQEDALAEFVGGIEAGEWLAQYAEGRR